MSTVSIYELHCDGPVCQATALTRSLAAMPEGWVRLASDAHLVDWMPGGRIPGRKGRTRADQRTYFDVHAGAFWLHLCPFHTEAFDGHRPVTVGGVADRTGDRRIQVGCSCGASLGSVINLTLVSGADTAPMRTPERAWWRHLPAALQGYVRRAQQAEGAER